MYAIGLLASAFAGVLAYGIGNGMYGLQGLKGWRWVFTVSVEWQIFSLACDEETVVLQFETITNYLSTDRGRRFCIGCSHSLVFPR